MHDTRFQFICNWHVCVHRCPSLLSVWVAGIGVSRAARFRLCLSICVAVVPCLSVSGSVSLVSVCASVAVSASVASCLSIAAPLCQCGWCRCRPSCSVPSVSVHLRRCPTVSVSVRRWLSQSGQCVRLFAVAVLASVASCLSICLCLTVSVWMTSV